MAIEFNVSLGTLHHNHADLLDTNPGDTTWNSIDLSNIVPFGTNAVHIDTHMISTHVDDQTWLAASTSSTTIHHMITYVANKASEKEMLIEIDPATRYLWWAVTDARVSSVIIEMYFSYR